ncbi:MAG: hypothetical protein GXY48_00465 [Methanomicrobiales archaeon]|nr:hypothetical protein [Methanomicrobiales archaeon]
MKREDSGVIKQQKGVISGYASTINQSVSIPGAWAARVRVKRHMISLAWFYGKSYKPFCSISVRRMIPSKVYS